MMSSEKLYAVTMIDLESHSYLLGVFSTVERAAQAGEFEQRRTNGKYSPFVQKVTLDNTIVGGLPQYWV